MKVVRSKSPYLDGCGGKSPHLIKCGDKLEKRAQRIAWLCSFAPFVRMIGLTGSVARNQAKESSDIDFFIFSEQNKMWTCRFFVTFLVTITGKRRHGKRIAGRICLNRYQTISNMEVLPHNKYNAWDYSYFTPIFNGNNYYYSFKNKNNWIKEFNQRFQPNQNIKPINEKFGKIIRGISEFLLRGKLGDLIELYLKKYQIKKIKNNSLYSSSNPNIIIGEDIFCAHTYEKTVEPS